MGNGVSVDQGNLPSYGLEDVSDAADRKQHDWSQLAEAPIIEQPSSALWSPRESYIIYSGFCLLDFCGLLFCRRGLYSIK